jgi:isopentenyldiphosphate isomerase
VHVLIFNDQGELAIQKRSATVSFCPDHWSTAVGGHVQTGETYEQAALREFMEELGIQNKIEFWRKDFYDIPNVPNKFIVTYRTVYNGPFNITSEDVAEARFFSLPEIQKMIEVGEKFHPELLFILKKIL